MTFRLLVPLTNRKKTDWTARYNIKEKTKHMKEDSNRITICANDGDDRDGPSLHMQFTQV